MSHANYRVQLGHHDVHYTYVTTLATILHVGATAPFAVESIQRRGTAPLHHASQAHGYGGQHRQPPTGAESEYESNRPLFQ